MDTLWFFPFSGVGSFNLSMQNGPQKIFVEKYQNVILQVRLEIVLRFVVKIHK